MLTSITRTAVPYLVGLVVALGLTLGVDVPVEAQVALANILTFIIGTAYYWAVRALAKKWPAVEVLLGKATPPVYGDTK